MVDVVEIARKRRAELAAEIARLDKFLRMAAALTQFDGGDSVAPVRPGLQGGVMPFLGENVAARRVSAVAEKAEPVSEATPEIAPKPEAAKSESRPAPQASGPSGLIDHFDFAETPEKDETPDKDETLVLNKPVAGPPTEVDGHVGQKLRQRRWMIGMSRQQLGDAIGVGLDEIRNYEMGTQHIGPSRMWQIAAVLDVPMSYFFDEIAGQSENGDAARGAVIGEAEAARLLEPAGSAEPKRAGKLR